VNRKYAGSVNGNVNSDVGTVTTIVIAMIVIATRVGGMGTVVHSMLGRLR